MPISFDKKWVGVRAPDIPDGMEWINSDSLKLSALKEEGKVVLIDFWTYSCVNCIRTLPYLKDWDEKYRDKGLVIIGVHSPEFDFEKNTDNVKRAVKELDIKYPVVVDSEHKIWDLWANNVWPRKFIVNHEGVVVYDHRGEGGYAETETMIQKTLQKATEEKLDLPLIDREVQEHKGRVCYPATPETYLGYYRGNLGNKGGLQKNKIAKYKEKADENDPGWFLEGTWESYGEYIKHPINTEKYKDYLLLRYEAIAVNIVAQTTEGGDAKLKVELDGESVPKEKRGQEVIEENGETFLPVSIPKMYNIISTTDEFHSGLLKLYANSDNVQLYAFTFGACEGH